MTNKRYQFFLIMLLVLGALQVQAQNRNRLTYQGRIIKPDGTALTDAATVFNVKIKTPDNSCILYEENKTVSVSDGFFSFQIGSGTRVDAGTYTFPETFQATTSFASTCGAYTPAVADDRRILVTFTTGTETVPLDVQQIKAVPFAIDTGSIGGVVSTDVITVAGATAASNPNSRNLSTTQFNNLISLINGIASSSIGTDQGGSMELGGSNTTANPIGGGTPYIDFHFGTGGAQNYNTRIINDADNQLSFVAANVTTSGQLRMTASYNAAAATSIDWNNGNMQYTSASCGPGTVAFTFTNMKDGGSYTLAVNGGTSGTCTFSQGGGDAIPGGNFKFAPANGPTVASKSTVYTFIRMGSNVFVSWITGYN